MTGVDTAAFPHMARGTMITAAFEAGCAGEDIRVASFFPEEKKLKPFSGADVGSALKGSLRSRLSKVL